jgi:hypothetical protein
VPGLTNRLFSVIIYPELRKIQGLSLNGRLRSEFWPTRPGLGILFMNGIEAAKRVASVLPEVTRQVSPDLTPGLNRRETREVSPGLNPVLTRRVSCRSCPNCAAESGSEIRLEVLPDLARSLARDLTRRVARRLSRQVSARAIPRVIRGLTRGGTI